MGSSMTSSYRVQTVTPAEPAAIPRVGGSAPTTPRELATQTPHANTYTLQQFVRLSGAQCRMSPAEVAYHNREHDRTRRAR